MWRRGFLRRLIRAWRALSTDEFAPNRRRERIRGTKAATIATPLEISAEIAYKKNCWMVLG
jgi:hypothetical protein